MEFHDILHGHIQFTDINVTPLLSELIESPEVHRLRNMRQMNFDVPLIQELGRSRRLPHSIGVASITLRLCHLAHLSSHETKVLIAAAMLHDAAIPPYGHLVESEFKRKAPNFSHEERLSDLILGKTLLRTRYTDVVPGKPPRMFEIFAKYGIKPEEVLNIVRPEDGNPTPISADIDIDNIDNVHRMAAMLGWDGVKENMSRLLHGTKLISGQGLVFAKECVEPIKTWLDYRQRIYTMIIAHPECIPYNALQADMVRTAVEQEIIEPDDWWLSEPVFEEKLRRHSKTKVMAQQLISGCDYSLVDYIWFKNFSSSKKLHNAQIVEYMLNNVSLRGPDYGYFVWNEKSLISRKIVIPGDEWEGSEVGKNSTSCMIALVKKTAGKHKFTKKYHTEWRTNIIYQFRSLFDVSEFEFDFPEDYSGNFLGGKNSELEIGYF